MTTYVFRISSRWTAVKNAKNIYLNIFSGEVENRIMSIKPSFTMLKRSMKALDRFGQNISQFLWWPLPLFYPLASVGVCKNEENCGPANPYLLRDWALCSRSLICYHLSFLSIRRRLHISIRDKKLGGRPTSVPTWLPRRRLALSFSLSLSKMSPPDLKVLWKSPTTTTTTKPEEFQWNSLQASSC